MTDTPDTTVTEKPDAKRFEAHVDGDLVAFLDYIPLEDQIIATHTEVLPDHEGKGIASQLVRGVVAHLRHDDRVLQPSAPTSPAGCAGTQTRPTSSTEPRTNWPPRAYELAAEVFARAAEQDATGTVRQVVQGAARQAGRELAADSDDADLVEHLRRHGFEPYDDEGVLRLGNCPFHHLARQHTELTCGMNLALLSGLTEALPSNAQPRLDPAPGRCCVALDPP